MLLYFRLVFMSLVFFEFIFAQPNFCSYEEDYYEYVPKTVNVLRKKPKKQKSTWSYLNPMNLFVSDNDYVTMKETEITAEKRKRKVTACCHGFKKNGNQCVSESDTTEKSTSQSVAVSSSTVSAALPTSPTSAETFAPKPSPTDGSNVSTTDLSSFSTTVQVTNTPAENAKKTEPLTSGVLSEPTVPATAATPGVTEGEHPTEIYTETKSHPSGDTYTIIDPTIESNSKLPPADGEVHLPPETVESVQTSSISQQTTAGLKNEKISTHKSSADNPSSKATLVPRGEDVSIISMVISSSESLPTTSVQDVPTNLATQPVGMSFSSNRPVASADEGMMASVFQTELTTTNSVSVLSTTIQALVVGDEVTAEKVTPSDTVTTSPLNTEILDIENKTKREIYQTVDFIENNNIATDVTPVKEHRKNKYSFIQYFIQVFFQFFRRLFQAK